MQRFGFAETSRVRPKAVSRAHSREGRTNPFCGQTSPQVCCRYVCRRVDSNLLPDTRQPAGMPAAFTGEEIPCRPKGRPAFRGGPRNRDFSRKKRFSPTCVLAASEIACRLFRRRGSGYGVTFQPAVVVSAGIGLLRSISIRRMGIPHHRFGAVEKRSQRFSLGAGEQGVLRPLTPRSKDVAAGICARRAQSCFAAKLRRMLTQKFEPTEKP